MHRVRQPRGLYMFDDEDDMVLIENQERKQDQKQLLKQASAPEKHVPMTCGDRIDSKALEFGFAYMRQMDQKKIIWPVMLSASGKSSVGWLWTMGSPMAIMYRHPFGTSPTEELILTPSCLGGVFFARPIYYEKVYPFDRTKNVLDIFFDHPQMKVVQLVEEYRQEEIRRQNDQRAFGLFPWSCSNRGETIFSVAVRHGNHAVAQHVLINMCPDDEARLQLLALRRHIYSPSGIMHFKLSADQKELIIPSAGIDDDLLFCEQTYGKAVADQCRHALLESFLFATQKCNDLIHTKFTATPIQVSVS